MDQMMMFSTREEFRPWLQDNCLREEGVWLLFGKAGGPKTLQATHALEEALCFGWINGLWNADGQRSWGVCWAMICCMVFKNSSIAGEKTWYFFQTRLSPTSNLGFRGRKHRLLSPVVLIRRSKVRA